MPIVALSFTITIAFDFTYLHTLNAKIRSLIFPPFQLPIYNGKKINMIDAGIVDPVLVTKSALKNAVSVALTIMSADCVISNIRVENASN